RTLHRYGAAHAVADEIRPRDIELLEQRRHIVGEVFVGDVAFAVRRAPVALHFDGNHFPRSGELVDPAGPIVGDGHERAVEQHHRFAAAVDFVVHFDAVDWCVASRWLLLRRNVSRHEHYQEESCCPHVWCYSVLLKTLLANSPATGVFDPLPDEEREPSQTFAAEGAPRPPGDARGRLGRIHRDTSKRVSRWPQ